MLLASLVIIALGCVRRQALSESVAIGKDGTRVSMTVECVGERLVWPTVEVEIRGRPYKFMLDTGTTGLAIGEALSQQLELAIVGTKKIELASGRVVELDLVTPPELKLGSARIPSQRSAVSPALGQLNVDHGCEIHGVIGSSLFDHVLVRMNYARGWAEFRRSSAGRSTGAGTFAPIVIRGGVPWVSVGIDGMGESQFQLDTGMAGPVVVRPWSAVAKRVAQFGEIAYLGETRTANHTGRLEGVQVAGEQLRDVPLAIYRTEHRGSAIEARLGSGLFVNGELTVDYPNRRFAFRTDAPVAALAGGFGVWVERRNRDLRVYRVDPNSPGATAGVRISDAIRAVDAVPVLASATEFYKRIRNQSEIELEVERGENVRKLKLRRSRYLPLVRFQ